MLDALGFGVSVGLIVLTLPATAVVCFGAGPLFVLGLIVALRVGGPTCAPLPFVLAGVGAAAALVPAVLLAVPCLPLFAAPAVLAGAAAAAGVAWADGRPEVLDPRPDAKRGLPARIWTYMANRST